MRTLLSCDCVFHTFFWLNKQLSIIVSVWCAIPKYHRLGGLKQQAFISHHAGGWEVQDQHPADSVWWGAFLVCSRLPSCYILAWQRERDIACELWSLPLLIRALSLHEDSTFMASSIPKHLPKAHFLKHHTGDKGFSRWIWRGDRHHSRTEFCSLLSAGVPRGRRRSTLLPAKPWGLNNCWTLAMCSEA